MGNGFIARTLGKKRYCKIRPAITIQRFARPGQGMLSFLLLAIAAFVLRFVAVRHAATGFDTYGHLYFAKKVKEQNSGPFGEIVTDVVGAGKYRHPFLWHWIVGTLPVPLILRLQKWISPTADALFSLCGFIVLRVAGYSEQIALNCALLYLLTPMWFSRIAIGPRISSLTPRLASELATNTFFVVAVLPLGLPAWLALAIAAALSAAILLTSKFGLQALVFLVPTVALATHTFTPVLAMALGLMVALAVSKGELIKTAREQLNHLRWYFESNKNNKTFVSNRNSLSRLWESKSTGETWPKRAKLIFGRMLLLNSYTGVLIKMPVLLVVYYVALLTLIHDPSAIPYRLIGPVVAATIVFFAINWPPLLFLGEAERYLNHVAFFIAAAAIVMADRLGLSRLCNWLLVYGFLYWAAESFLLHNLFPAESKSRRNADDAIIAHLRAVEAELVVLGYPYHASGGAYRIMLETHHKAIFCFMLEREFAKLFESEFAADYPFVRLEQVERMSDELGVDFLILDKEKLKERGQKDWAPSERWQPIDIGTPYYQVYRRHRASAKPIFSNRADYGHAS